MGVFNIKLVPDALQGSSAVRHIIFLLYHMYILLLLVFSIFYVYIRALSSYSRIMDAIL